ncbi:MAG TPA: glucose 1-dehydrogenase [Candidatus Deferrimicrobium sp.]|nr:glucose 1-dehydrogenase [Candidatus Deferrimicrobium sp.]
MGRLDGRVALVTGGASGLGEATARRFIAEGASVVIADLQDDRGGHLAGELGADADFIRTDVTREDDVAAAVDRAVDRYGALDVMFNNAGIVGATGPIAALDLEEYEATMAVLLRGAVLGMKHAARVMVPRRSGSILSTSSVAGVMGGLGPHVYSTAKAAIIGLTQSVAAELVTHGIRVNCIVPGSMATPMVADVALGDPDAVDAVRTVLDHQSPIGRAGVADDIANAALYLACDESGYVTGQALRIDAGTTLTVPGNPFINPDGTGRGMIREAGRRGL